MPCLAFECSASGSPLSVSCCGAGRTTLKARTTSLSDQLIFPLPVIHFVIPPRSDLTPLTDRNTAAPRLVILGREPLLFLFLVPIYLPILYLDVPMLPSSFSFSVFMPFRSINSMALKRTMTWVLLFSFLSQIFFFCRALSSQNYPSFQII